jgi:oligopeptidase B
LEFVKISSVLAVTTACLCLAACAKPGDNAISDTENETMTADTTATNLAKATAGLEAPMADRRPRTTVQQGIERVDDYAWLKDDNWQTVLRDPGVLRADVRSHLEAELNYYEAATSGDAAIRERLLAEMRGRIKEDDSSVPVKDGPYEYLVRYRDGGEYPIFGRRTVADESEQVLFDGDLEAGDSAFFSVGSVDHSPDHSLIAYSVDRLGSEYYAMRFRRIDDGTEFGETIASTSGEAVWAADSASVFYVERDDNQRPKRVRRHVLGTDPGDDPVVYDEADDGMFVGIEQSLSGAYVFIVIENQVTSEVHYVPLRNPGAPAVLIAPRVEQQMYSVEHHGDEFFITTNADDAVDFKIVRAPVERPGRDQWVDWVAHEAGTQILTFIPYAEHNVRLERSDALPRVVVSDYAGVEHEIAFEQAAYQLEVSAGYEYDTVSTRFVYESPSQPAQTFDYDMTTRERTLRKTREVPSGHDPSLYVVERIDAVASDGARIPVTLLRLATTIVDGTAPLLLYGYGSYGLTIPAGFNANVLSMVDRGVVYAIAHIRGGSARGRQWYFDGKLDKKINTFTDFVTVAEDLVDRGYAAEKRIVIYGGSAGGLLVGAAVNLRPDLFAGVLASVPFVDVLNTMSDETLPLTPPEWPEWGDPIRSAEGYAWIAAYSPYDNIAVGADYPPILATSGLTDYRVTYWEPAKWIARLRAEAGGGPFLLRLNMEAGHGGAAARFERLEEISHLFAFALNVLGSSSVEPVSHR